MVLELQKPRPIWQIMFSTHHTDIGLLYLLTSLAFMFMGGALALILRLELFAPGTHLETPGTVPAQSLFLPGTFAGLRCR